MDPSLLPAAVLAALSLAQDASEPSCEWPPGPDYAYEERPKARVEFGPEIRYEARTTICLSFIDIDDKLRRPVTSQVPDAPALLQLRADFDAAMSESAPTSFSALVEEEPAAPWLAGAPHPRLDAEIEALDPELALPLDAARGLRLRRLRREHHRQAEQRLARQGALSALEQSGQLPGDVLALLRAEEPS